MVYTPQQLNEFDIVDEMRNLADLAERKSCLNTTLAKKMALKRAAKLLREDANRRASSIFTDKAA